MQRRVALSTAESEYRAASIACKDIIWMRRLCKTLKHNQTEPTVMFEDNGACMKMITNPMISARNKHIEMDMHFIRDHYELQAIIPKKIATTNQKADILTKNLGKVLFQKHATDILYTPE